MSQTVLVLFCKEPRVGYAKQRLAAGVGAEEAYRVAAALIDCAIEDLAAWAGPVVIAAAAANEVDWARSLIRRPSLRDSAVEVVVQSEGNLGERLADMDARLRTADTDAVCFIGADAPALNASHYAHAKRALATHDVVLADSADGGVTLMASRSGWPPLAGLPWGTRRLGVELAAACRKSGRSVLRFDGGLDLDEVDDVPRLLATIANDPRPARRVLAGILAEVAID